MNRKKLKQGLLVMALGMGLYGSANALMNPDTIVVSVTPGGLTYAVAITSPFVGGGYQFGTVAMGATTISTVGITVQNTGNVGEYFAMKVGNTSPDGWTPIGSAPGSNQFELIGWLAATQPLASTFVVGSALSGAIPGTGNGLYGQGSRTAPTATTNLWLDLTMPSSVTGSGGAQTMTVFVNGQSS